MVAIRGTVCNNLLRTVSLLHTVPHQWYLFYNVFFFNLKFTRTYPTDV
jgi:hypothetical protein